MSDNSWGKASHLDALINKLNYWRGHTVQAPSTWLEFAPDLDAAIAALSRLAAPALPEERIEQAAKWLVETVEQCKWDGLYEGRASDHGFSPWISGVRWPTARKQDYRDAVQEIVRLAVPTPALPEDIAGLVEQLRNYHGRAAAALQAQAAEIERLTNGNEQLKEMAEHFSGLNEFAQQRIAGLEAACNGITELLEPTEDERAIGDGYTFAKQKIEGMKKRNAELEADRDEWKQCAEVEAQARREFKEMLEKAEAELAKWQNGSEHGGWVKWNDHDAALRRNRELEAEIVEALQLTESCSTLKEMAAACVAGAILKAVCERLRADLHGMQDGSLLRDLRAENERLQADFDAERLACGKAYGEREQLRVQLRTVEDECGEWKQCAEVEAKVRREFNELLEKTQATLAAAITENERLSVIRPEILKAERDWLAKRSDDLQGEVNAVRRRTIKECGDIAHAEGHRHADTPEEFAIAMAIEEAIRGLADKPQEQPSQSDVDLPTAEDVRGILKP